VRLSRLSVSGSLRKCLRQCDCAARSPRQKERSSNEHGHAGGGPHTATEPYRNAANAERSRSASRTGNDTGARIQNPEDFLSDVPCHSICLPDGRNEVGILSATFREMAQNLRRVALAVKAVAYPNSFRGRPKLEQDEYSSLQRRRGLRRVQNAIVSQVPLTIAYRIDDVVAYGRCVAGYARRRSRFLRR
jgi:hypothetical protein